MSITVTSTVGTNGSNFDPSLKTKKPGHSVTFKGNDVPFYAYYYDSQDQLQWAFGVSSCTATQKGQTYTLVSGATDGTTVTLSTTNPALSSPSPSTAGHGGSGRPDNGPVFPDDGTNGTITVSSGNI